jgi:5-methyltetrahydrofolate--homocysteine methyltransferase
LKTLSIFSHVGDSRAIAKGLDGAIINPLDRRMMANIIAAEALAGKDNFCMNYLKAFRAGLLEE